MPSSRQSASSIYAQQMLSFGYGSALWEPPPLYNYERINIGDVGYISDGSFHLLFSAATPLGDRRLGEDVPDSFEPLEVGPVVRYQPRVPGYLCTKTVRVRGADIGASVSSTAISPGVHLAFELTDNQGAILVTKYPTYREDAERKSRFKKYIKRHHDSWVTFARYHDHDDSIQPILVTGMDLTLDFAMLAYSNNTGRLVTEFKAGAPLIISASASVWGSWNTEGLVHHNCGPQVCAPPPTSDPESSHHPTSPDGNSNTYNQCLFLRYYSLRKRAGLFPKIIKAGAGPHNFDPGSDSSDSEFAVKLINDDPMEVDVVYQNTPLPIDPLDCVAEYIFRNSSAKTALVHHDDISSFLEVFGDATDMENICSKISAQIFVDLDGSGQIMNPSSFSSTFSGAMVASPSEMFSQATLSTTSTFAEDYHDGVDIPQRPYKATNDRKYGDVILFSVEGKSGFSAGALNYMYGRLDGRDDSVFEAGCMPSYSIRLEWPGYPSWGRQFRTMDYREPPRPVSRATLAKRLVKLLARFIDQMTDTPQSLESYVWEIGPSSGIKLDDLVLISLERVSRGSWQPHLRLTTEASLRRISSTTRRIAPPRLEPPMPGWNSLLERPWLEPPPSWDLPLELPWLGSPTSSWNPLVGLPRLEPPTPRHTSNSQTQSSSQAGTSHTKTRSSSQLEPPIPRHIAPPRLEPPKLEPPYLPHIACARVDSESSTAEVKS